MVLDVAKSSKASLRLSRGEVPDIIELSFGFVGSDIVNDEKLKELRADLSKLISSQLDSLHFYGTQVGDEGLAQLAEFTSLRQLVFVQSNITDQGLKHISGLVNLETLWLDESQITDRGLPHLRSLTNLTVLDLRRTNVSDAGMEHLEPVFASGNLKYLVLAGTSVSPEKKLEIAERYGCEVE